MIVDSSSVIAILKGEPDRAAHVAAILEAKDVWMSAATRVEVEIVASGLSLGGADALLAALGIGIVDFTVEHARAASSAHHRYGRGSGSKARLNFGDCMSYAVAKTRDEPLLFKGDDFRHTDVTPVL